MWRRAVEDQVLIDLVADRVGVVAQHQVGDEAQFVGGEHLAGRVHRRVQQDRLGLRPERVGQRGARQRPVGRLQPHQARDGAEQADDRQIGVVQRLDQHDLVAGVQHRHQAGGDRLGGAGGHHHLARPVDLEAVEAAVGGGDRLAQFRHAGHRRILVAAVLQRVGGGLHHVVRAVGVGEALAEIDRVVLDRQRRHHGEDRGADTGQQGVGGLHLATLPFLRREGSMGFGRFRFNG